MSIPLIINGVSWTYPQTGDTNWGVQATGWANAVTVGMLQKAGGAFTLTAEVDFGASFGLMAPYYKSKGTNISTTGVSRLARNESLGWRNESNSADLLLGVNSSDALTFDGDPVRVGLIVNADIDAAAAIAFSKMASLTASRALQSGSGGVVEVSAVTATELGYLSGVTSALQTQISARLPLAGGTMTGDLVLNGSPTADLQAATKAYVDLVGSGLSYKESVVVATTTAGTLASDFEDGDTVDGVVLATGDRILIKNQASAPENGLYIVAATGAPTRSTDADTWDELLSAFVFVENGTANADTNWVCNIMAGGTLGVNDVTFVQQSAPGTYSADGEGIELTSTTFSLELDGATLSKSASGLKVADGGIANTQVNASAAIAVNKLAALTASRALVSDGSGFLSAATTTATEIGYVNGVTSAIQTQLDAKIAASVMTTNNDMIYRAAGVPARLAAGTDTYVLTSNSGVPTWTDPKKSVFVVKKTGTQTNFPTSWTSLALENPETEGNPWTRSGNDLTAIYTGLHMIVLSFGNIENNTSSERFLMFRLRNITDGTTVDKSVSPGWEENLVDEQGTTLILWPNITNVAKTYQVQVCASGNNLRYLTQTIDGETSYLWTLSIIKL